jgi:hypothetical protein
LSSPADLYALISDEGSFAIFLFASIFLGGGAAALAGRAVAAAWLPPWRVIPFMLMLGVAVRFIHYAVFGSTFLSLYYYSIDTAVCIVFGLFSFRLTRVRQMVGRYGWINKRAGPFGWRARL